MIKFKEPEKCTRPSTSLLVSLLCPMGMIRVSCRKSIWNEDYWNHMGINPIKGNQRNVAAEGGIVSIYYCGTLIGALIAGSLADRCGRIRVVVFGSMWALRGAVLQASAQNIAWMCCACAIVGVGVGAIDCVIPV